MTRLSLVMILRRESSIKSSMDWFVSVILDSRKELTSIRAKVNFVRSKIFRSN